MTVSRQSKIGCCSFYPYTAWHHRACQVRSQPAVLPALGRQATSTSHASRALVRWRQWWCRQKHCSTTFYRSLQRCSIGNDPRKHNFGQHQSDTADKAPACGAGETNFLQPQNGLSVHAPCSLSQGLTHSHGRAPRMGLGPCRWRQSAASRPKRPGCRRPCKQPRLSPRTPAMPILRARALRRREI